MSARQRYRPWFRDKPFVTLIAIEPLRQEQPVMMMYDRVIHYEVCVIPPLKWYEWLRFRIEDIFYNWWHDRLEDWRDARAEKRFRKEFPD